MFRMILTAAVALLALACTPAAAPSPSIPSQSAHVIDQAANAAQRASVAVTRAEAAYERVKGMARLVAPMLSPARAAQLQALEAMADAAFARARLTTDLAVQATELSKAAAAAAQIDNLAAIPAR